jgi:hypothetical protein
MARSTARTECASCRTSPLTTSLAVLGGKGPHHMSRAWKRDEISSYGEIHCPSQVVHRLLQMNALGRTDQSAFKGISELLREG